MSNQRRCFNDSSHKVATPQCGHTVSLLPAVQNAVGAREVIYICICIYIYTYIYNHTTNPMYTYIFMYIYMYIYIYIYMYTYIDFYIYRYIYIYIYTYLFIYSYCPIPVYKLPWEQISMAGGNAERIFFWGSCMETW